jgi:hypothetical protein
MIDFNDILRQPWLKYSDQFTYQVNCLRPPLADDGIWDLNLPKILGDPNKIFVIHCQDFLNLSANGCRELQMIENHFGDLAHRVVVITWEIDMQERYQGPVHLSYFPTHTYNIIVNMRNCLEMWQPRLLGSRNTRYQCLNGIPRKHRERTVALLDQLAIPGHVSLGPGRTLPMWPYYPNYFGCENEDNYIKLLYVYGDSDINIVTETHYDERPGIITEKSLFALMSLQVPMFIGYRGMIDHVRGLGFDVFDDIVDTSYDWLPNDVRINEAIRRNQHLLQHGIDRSILHPRLQANQDLVLRWPEKMIKDYQQRCAEIQDCLSKV